MSSKINCDEAEERLFGKAMRPKEQNETEKIDPTNQESKKERSDQGGRGIRLIIT